MVVAAVARHEAAEKAMKRWISGPSGTGAPSLHGPPPTASPGLRPDSSDATARSRSPSSSEARYQARIFKRYAGKRAPHGATFDQIAASNDLLDLTELSAMFRDLNLMPGIFDVQTLKRLFVAAQQDQDKGTMTFAEWKNCMRMCLEAVSPEDLSGETLVLQTLAGEKLFERSVRNVDQSPPRRQPPSPPRQETADTVERNPSQGGVFEETGVGPKELDEEPPLPHDEQSQDAVVTAAQVDQVIADIGLTRASQEASLARASHAASEKAMSREIDRLQAELARQQAPRCARGHAR